MPFPEQKCSGFIEGRQWMSWIHRKDLFPEQKCSGFIEGRARTTGPTPGRARFRSRNAPASLKDLPSRSTSHEPMPGFRSRNAPASLKGRRPGAVRLYLPRFRSRNAPASLKACGGAYRQRGRQRRFRSRNAPASLKAGAYAGRPEGCRRFPEQKCSGFIEGPAIAANTPTLLLFPEQKCSGFIEGTWDHHRAGLHGGRFRSRNAPASLKEFRQPVRQGI